MTMNFEDLTNAIKENQGVKELSDFIAIGGKINLRLPDTNWTLLHLAVEFKDPTIIEALYNYGADIEAEDSNGWTPLHLAVDVDIDSVIQSSDNDVISFDTVSILVSLGANLNSKTKNGETPRDIASYYGKKALKTFDNLISKLTQLS